MKPLSEIFGLAEAQEETEYVSYVVDGEIHYIVMKQDENSISIDWIKEFVSILDQIEATKGPGVVVTVSSSKKHFSTGFDMM